MKNRPAQVRNTRDQSCKPMSSPLKFSGWYLAANSANPTRPSSVPSASCALTAPVPQLETYLSHSLPSGSSARVWASCVRVQQLETYLSQTHLPSCLVGFQQLSHLLRRFLVLSQSTGHFCHLLNQRCHLLFHNSELIPSACLASLEVHKLCAPACSGNHAYATTVFLEQVSGFSWQRSSVFQRPRSLSLR